MCIFNRRLWLMLLVGIATLAWNTPPAHTQVYRNYPLNTYSFPYYGGGYGGWGGYPYYGGGGYPYSGSQSNYNVNYTYNPADYLKGGASVISAQGDFLVKQQEASKLQQEAKMAQLDYKRKSFDQALYEKEHSPSPEEVAAQKRMDAYRASLNDPPFIEITSGRALNTLMDGLMPVSPQVSPPARHGQDVPLDPDLLSQINVTFGNTGSNLGILKDVGRLNWPSVVRGTPEQKKLDELLPKAVQQATSGSVDFMLLMQMDGELEKMKEGLEDKLTGADLNPNIYIQAKRFINDIQSSLKTLRQPNTSDYFNGKFAAKGSTVGELLWYMQKNGLKFAPALGKEEPAYVSLHRAMVSYAGGVAPVAAADGPASSFRVRVGNPAPPPSPGG